MKNTPNAFIILLMALTMSCGGSGEKKKEKFSYKRKPVQEQKSTSNASKVSDVPASKKVDLVNKGIGPVTSLVLPKEIDATLVTHGAEVFKKMCTACHKPNKKFIGPAPKGILEKRTPEWIMNMILNPTEMVQKDPLAKALLIEFNGSPMANQNLSHEDARAVLEYFRTLN
ncbi:MAG: cytochrome c [Flavobacteriaceae bacterium]